MKVVEKCDILDFTPSFSLGVKAMMGIPKIHASYPFSLHEFVRYLGLDFSSVSYARQIHSNQVKECEFGGFAGNCDALITDHRNIILAIQVADCLPIFIYDPSSRTIGLVHAGWRGTSNEISLQAVERMILQYHTDIKNLEVFIGPCIMSCCYQVGNDMAKQFPSTFLRKDGSDRYRLDLIGVTCNQLIKTGIRSFKIQTDNRCTCCDHYGFHSYRRQKSLSGRQICLFYLT